MPPTTRRKRLLYWVYGLLSISYSATVMLFIYRLFRNFYANFFPDFGVVFLIVTLYFVFRKKARTLMRVSKAAYLDKKELLMSKRGRIPILASLLGILFVIAIPWTRRTISEDATLRPIREVTLQSPEDGVVAEVLVHEGDLVKPGTPLFRIASTAIDSEAVRSAYEDELHIRKSSTQRAAANPAMMFQSDARAAAAHTALATARSRQEFLTVKSPISGRVLTSRVEDLEGRNVAAAFPLVRIGDTHQLAADVAVSERLLDYLSVGSAVTAKIGTRSLKSYHGTVASLSPATMDRPATAAAGKDPDIPSGAPDRFVAMAVFDNADGSLFPGSAAKLKIHAKRESYLSRGFSIVWRWFRSVIW